MASVSDTAQRPPRWIAAVALLVFASIIVICIWIPTAAFIDMMAGISKRSTTVEIDKGSYYLFGVGIMFAALLPDGIYTSLLRRPLSKRAHHWVTGFALAGLALVVILPHVIHYPVTNILEKRGYEVCEKQSHQWLFLNTVVYSRSDDCASYPKPSATAG